MYDIRNLNIWKEKTEEKTGMSEDFWQTPVSELNLSVRSYNCLKRAGCDTVRDIWNLAEGEEMGLKKIRNLGTRSEAEILSCLQELKDACEKKKAVLVKEEKKPVMKPDRSIWDTGIEAFHLSKYAMNELKRCGINRVGDLYATNPGHEPGWYSVRELFRKIS